MDKLNYVLGLDIGVASIGWGITEYNDRDEPVKIIDAGSVIFSALDNDKGKLYNVVRRDARGHRRVIRRKAERLKRIKSLIIRENLISKQELETLYVGNIPQIYDLRLKGLKEKLTNKELSRVLIHYAKNRGFKSNRKIEDIKVLIEDENKSSTSQLESFKSDDKKLKPAIENTTKLMKEENLKVIEAIFKIKELKGLDTFKNRDGNYNYGFTRQQIQEEVECVLDCQINLGLIDNEFKNEYLEILMSQRDFSEGPGGDSKYKVDYEQVSGKCKYTGERRAVKNVPSYEIFIFLQKLNDIRYYEEIIGETKKREKNV